MLYKEALRADAFESLTRSVLDEDFSGSVNMKKNLSAGYSSLYFEGLHGSLRRNIQEFFIRISAKVLGNFLFDKIY